MLIRTAAMDATDTRLLALLCVNAREPIAALARRLGVARATVTARIARLQRSGAIGAFTVQIGAEALRHQVTAIVLVNANPKMTDRVVAALRRMPEIHSLKAVSGIYDLIAEVRVDGTGEADRVLDEIGRLAGIERTMSSIVLSTKFTR